MSPALFETPHNPKVPPRNLGGEIARMLDDEELVHDLSGIQHPKSERGSLPDQLVVHPKKEPTKEGESDEDVVPDLKMQI